MAEREGFEPSQDLAGCPNCQDAHCYTTQPPLLWNDALARAARFHAANLTSAGCGISHDSPCALESSIGADYPDTCDGSVSCACVGGTADCCGAGNSTYSDRLGAFGFTSGIRGENIAAGLLDPFSVFYLWLWESTDNSTCGFTMENGHRYNILSGNSTHIGIGRHGSITVQEFWSGTSESLKIPSGSHYPQSGSEIEFRANWYDGQPPGAAKVNINGAFHDMVLERGSAGNATYLLETDAGESCTRYYFHFIDSTGGVATHPGRGSFGINCAYDWTDSRPGFAGTATIVPLLLSD
ncbi:MAG: hypothetical protein JW793_04965 [Acidobacteria bacterium]|nr:hypothetical protein [Acidobacteriota bacterium]